MSKLAIALSLCISLPIVAQQPQEVEESLVNAVLRLIKGTVVPAHAHFVNGQVYSMPDGCAFEFKLPPGQRALQWQPRGKPLIDKAANTCEIMMLEGVPARFAEGAAAQQDIGETINASSGPPPIYAWTNSSGYFRAWMTDPLPFPLTITVNESRANISWGWDDEVTTLLCNKLQRRRVLGQLLCTFRVVKAPSSVSNRPDPHV